MTAIRRLVIVSLCLGATVGCDQATKRVAVETLRGTPGHEYLGGLFQLRYAENSGAFLSLGGTLPASVRFAIFTVGVGLLLAGLLAWALFSRRARGVEVLALAMVAAGGLSNLFDRLVNDGRVVDFMILGAGPVRTGVFNVADIAIMAGAGLLFVASLRRGKPGEASEG